MARIAQKERKYWCSLCSKGFTGQGDLNRHVLTVHKLAKWVLHICAPQVMADVCFSLRPFRCPTCSKTFAQKSAMKSHLNIHTGAKPHVCSIGTCTKSFGDPSSCSRHEREVHGGIRYCCPYCGSATKRKTNMQKHLKKEHKLMKLSSEDMQYLLSSLVKIEEPESPELLPMSPPTEGESDTESSPPPQVSLPNTPTDYLSASLESIKLSEDPSPFKFSPKHAFYDPMSDVTLPFCALSPDSMLVSYGYPEGYSYVANDDHLFWNASPCSSLGSSPVSLSPSPEPSLLYEPSIFGSSLDSHKDMYTYDDSPLADWIQPSLLF
ncbi:hypothetical protein BDW22DRAFT_466329 [Trametopsis cervina]|nr:hypothetical protein BDW22DRAFT_466329 [Trametopsis cervina]